jgi:molybdopterin/thiamine biosynthesis adenylyltransferase
VVAAAGWQPVPAQLGAQFFSALHGVVACGSSVGARLFLDEQCVSHQLSMLDTGVHGALASTQVIQPRASCES